MKQTQLSPVEPHVPSDFFPSIPLTHYSNNQYGYVDIHSHEQTGRREGFHDQSILYARPTLSLEGDERRYLIVQRGQVEKGKKGKDVGWTFGYG